jgi:hypothetical protein
MLRGTAGQDREVVFADRHTHTHTHTRTHTHTHTHNTEGISAASLDRMGGSVCYSGVTMVLQWCCNDVIVVLCGYRGKFRGVTGQDREVVCADRQ